MKSVLIALYAAGFPVSWYLTAGMCFANMQGKSSKFAAEGFREHLGFAVVIGFLYAIFWPWGLPMAWCLSGFAEHGIWRRRGRKGIAEPK